MRNCRKMFAAFAMSLASIAVALADDPKVDSFVANGVRISYLQAGSGEPVLLIHGLHSSAVMNWKMPGIFDALAKDHWVIALDLPGHGRSDKPNSAEAYGLQVVEDVIALLDHLKIEKAHVVGYSLGGMVAAKLVALHPDKVLTLTLGGMGWLRAGSPLQKFWERIPERGENRTPHEFIQGISRYALSEDDIQAIEVPVKIFVGDRDPVKRLYVEPLRKVRTDWAVVEIEGAGHINCIVKPEFRDGIVEWINANAGKHSPPK